ncbi:MAG: hypothetical protein Q7T82_18020, partial [Armatimonadota bacterium]|nr:hypothetical protein [Armatimonadota bacterium]
HTFVWDGSTVSGAAEPGTYTYEIEVQQPADGDSATYRSQYLRIIRAVDEYGGVIYDAEFYGYDDNGTPEDDSDDEYQYFIRYYALKDDHDTAAKEGTLTLYNWDMQPLRTWVVNDLYCDIHGWNDGLDATAQGLQHGLIVAVPISLLEASAEECPDDPVFRWVLHVKDDHAGLYRDHRERWALNLNQKSRRQKVWNFDCNTEDGDTLDRIAQFRQKYPWCGVNPYYGETCYQAEGYLAYAMGSQVATTVHDRLKRANVFFFHGHAGPGGLKCANDGAGEESYLLAATCGDPGCPVCDAPSVAVGDINLGQCKLAVLMGCHSGCTGVHGNLPERLLDRGVACVVGFNNTITYSSGAGGEEYTFARVFWDALCVPNDCEPKIVSEALREARDEVRRLHGDYAGYNSGVVIGTDLTIIPY